MPTICLEWTVERSAEHERAMAAARYYASYRIALRRLVAYLAIRWGNAWLNANIDILEGYLPARWQSMAHHLLVAYLDVQGITLEHCILA